MAAGDPQRPGQHARGDAGGDSADRGLLSEMWLYARARVFVIAQLVLNLLLSTLPQRAPRTAG